MFNREQARENVIAGTDALYPKNPVSLTWLSGPCSRSGAGENVAVVPAKLPSLPTRRDPSLLDEVR